MEFDCTKEGKNIYFACREKAAKYNDLLNSRERAAELLGISTSTLANHELGVTKNVPPDGMAKREDYFEIGLPVTDNSEISDPFSGGEKKQEASKEGDKK